MKPEPFFPRLASGFLVSEFTCAILLADWSINGWKLAGRRETWHLQLKT